MDEVQRKIKKYREEVSTYSSFDDLDSVIIGEIYHVGMNVRTLP